MNIRVYLTLGLASAASSRAARPTHSSRAVERRIVAAGADRRCVTAYIAPGDGRHWAAARGHVIHVPSCPPRAGQGAGRGIAFVYPVHSTTVVRSVMGRPIELSPGDKGAAAAVIQ